MLGRPTAPPVVPRDQVTVQYGVLVREQPGGLLGGFTLQEDGPGRHGRASAASAKAARRDFNRRGMADPLGFASDIPRTEKDLIGSATTMDGRGHGPPVTAERRQEHVIAG